MSFYPDFCDQCNAQQHVTPDGEHQCTNIIFVYGILKRGFDLDLEENGGRFICPATLPGAVLHSIGSGVGLRFSEDPLEVVPWGELFLVPGRNTWRWLDTIESNGFCYTRKVVNVFPHAIPQLPPRAWVYEHTFPGFDYTYCPVIEGGKF